MELSIIRKRLNHVEVLSSQSFVTETPQEIPYIPPSGTSNTEWFKWYSDVYLKSTHWINMRDRILKRDEHRCRFCGCSSSASNPLQIHHRDYESLWRETDATLITLCKICHKGLHRIKK